MKKYSSIVVSFMICLSLLTGCGNDPVAENTSETTSTNADVTTEPISEPASSTTSSEESSGKTITPLPSTIDITALNNCSVPVGFEAKNVYLEDGSRLVIRMTVYDSELFDMADIAELEKGDTLVLNGENIEVDSVEDNGYGLLSINGGYENGGIWLSTADTGVYYEVQENAARTYYPIGEVILPVDQDFVFRDSSDPGRAEKVSCAGDLIMDMDGSERVFSPNATIVTIGDGTITGLTIIFAP